MFVEDSTNPTETSDQTAAIEASTSDAQTQTPEESTGATPANAQASDDAAFEQGFNAATGNDAPDTENHSSHAEQEPEPAYTPEQVKELIETVGALKQREAKVFGTIGALKQQIDALKSQHSPQPQAIKLAADGLKRLHAEFPEMAQMLSEDLSEALSGGAPGVDQTHVAQMVEQTVGERLEAESRKLEVRILTVMHPDWRSVVATPEFGQWKSSLPPEEQSKFDNSWDAEYLGGQFSAFKDWKSKTVQRKQSSQRRLERAIAPGSSANHVPAPSAEDAFVQGFREARGIR